jgi:cell division protein FtsQ
VSARIARGGGGGSSGAKARPKAKQPQRGRATRKPEPSLLDSLPLPAETIRKVSWILFLLVLLALAVASAVAMRVPQTIGTAIGEAIGDAGFEVKRVEINGLERMERLPVYSVALDQPSMAMPLVDLEGTRQRLMRYGWVREARVSRRWPDTLVVEVVEREPAAIWQHNRKLTLIDHDGVVLERVKLDKMPDLPLVIGPAANRHAGELNRLLASTPQVRPMLAGATWVGGRRWDLRFQSGETLALPEGQEAATKALVHFGRMDQAAQLLGRGLVRFDMRVPGKMIVRVSNEPGSVVPILDADGSGGAPIDARKTI